MGIHGGGRGSNQGNRSKTYRAWFVEDAGKRREITLVGGEDDVDEGEQEEEDTSRR